MEALFALSINLMQPLKMPLQSMFVREISFLYRNYEAFPIYLLQLLVTTDAVIKRIGRVPFHSGPGAIKNWSSAR